MAAGELLHRIGRPVPLQRCTITPRVVAKSSC
jgi:hypothetical protein